MPPENGDGPDGAAGTIETGGIVDFGNINAPPIAENSPRPQAADAAVRPVDPVVIDAAQAPAGMCAVLSQKIGG